MNSIVQIRKANSSDVPRMRQFLVANGQRPSIELDQDAIYFFAEMDSQLIGMIGVELNPPNALLRSAGVLAPFRNRGLATRLFGVLIQSLRDLEVTDVFLFSKDAGAYWMKKRFSRCTIQKLIGKLSNVPQVAGYLSDGSIWKDVAWHRQLSDVIHHLELTDNEFETNFEKLTLSASLFTHEAHLRLAWIHLRRYAKHKAFENITRQLAQFTRYVGMENKFDETLTIASTNMIYSLMNEWPVNDFANFILRYPRLSSEFKSVLKEHGFKENESNNRKSLP